MNQPTHPGSALPGNLGTKPCFVSRLAVVSFLNGTTIAQLFALVRAGKYAAVTNGVFDVTGVRARTLAVYAHDHAADLMQ